MNDYTLQLEQIIQNQKEEITLLKQQVELLLEQINGFSLVASYLHSAIGIAVIVICLAILWKVLSGWFFRGV